MATQVNLGDIVQVTPRFLIEGQQCENVLYFECVAEDLDMLADLLLVIAQCLITHLLPVLGSNVTLLSVKGKVVGPALGPEDEWLPVSGDIVQGAAAGDSEPSFVAAVISIHTARPGRSGRGRMYIGGIPEGSTTGSLLNTEDPLWTGLLNFIACIFASFGPSELGSGAKYQWAIYSRKVGAVTKPPYPSAGLARITRALPNRELGTMRSRKIGHGK